VEVSREGLDEELSNEEPEPYKEIIVKKKPAPKPTTPTKLKAKGSPGIAAEDKLKNKELNKKHEIILKELLKIPENRTCADCNSENPDWASINIGIFVCCNCSGHHRNLGVHISKVRSVNLDTWTEDQIKVMKSVGNGIAKSIYEANVPDSYPPITPYSNTSDILMWIKDKYEFGRFKVKPSKK